MFECNYLEIINYKECKDHYEIFVKTNENSGDIIDECLYFIEKFCQKDGEYWVIDDNTAEIHLF